MVNDLLALLDSDAEPDALLGALMPEAEALWAEAAVNKLMPPSGGYMHKIEGAGFDLPSFLLPRFFRCRSFQT